METVITIVVFGLLAAGVAYIVKRRKGEAKGTGAGSRDDVPPSQQK